MANKGKTNPFQVFPELLDKRISKVPYKVRSGEKVSISNRSRKLDLKGISGDVSDEYKHELGHRLWSDDKWLFEAPPNWPASLKYEEHRDKWGVVQNSFEDARVNLGLKACNLQVNFKAAIDSMVALRQSASGPPQLAANPTAGFLIAVSLLGSDMGSEEGMAPYIEGLRLEGVTDLNEMLRDIESKLESSRHGRQAADFSVVQDLAVEFYKGIADVEDEQQAGPPAPPEPGQEAGSGDGQGTEPGSEPDDAGGAGESPGPEGNGEPSPSKANEGAPSGASPEECRVCGEPGSYDPVDCEECQNDPGPSSGDPGEGINGPGSPVSAEGEKQRESLESPLNLDEFVEREGTYAPPGTELGSNGDYDGSLDGQTSPEVNDMADALNSGTTDRIEFLRTMKSRREPGDELRRFGKSNAKHAKGTALDDLGALIATSDGKKPVDVLGSLEESVTAKAEGKLFSAHHRADGAGAKAILSDPEMRRVLNAASAKNPNGGWCPMIDISEHVQKRGIGSIVLDTQGRLPYRNAEEGSVVRSPERMFIDGKIFRAPAVNRKGWQGGTVVIDVSGSMRLSYTDVLALIEKAPYRTTIATYSSGGRHRHLQSYGHRAVKEGRLKLPRKLQNGPFGHLTVLARDGKVVRPDWLQDNHSDVFMGGNGVDGLALKWLTKMPEPRVWISDHYVHGFGGVSAQSLVLWCTALCEDHRIKRIINLTSFMNYVASGKEKDWVMPLHCVPTRDLFKSTDDPNHVLWRSEQAEAIRRHGIAQRGGLWTPEISYEDYMTKAMYEDSDLRGDGGQKYIDRYQPFDQMMQPAAVTELMRERMRTMRAAEVAEAGDIPF